MATVKDRIRTRLRERVVIGGTRVVRIEPGRWYPIDTWMAAWDAAKDPGDSYYSYGLKQNRLWN